MNPTGVIGPGFLNQVPTFGLRVYTKAYDRRTAYVTLRACYSQVSVLAYVDSIGGFVRKRQVWLVVSEFRACPPHPKTPKPPKPLNSLNP